jgi:uncharacterized protein YdhG (YjbR/CyaY superfamily)
MSAEQIDHYLDGLDGAKRATLARLRATILRLVPEAEEGLSYGVPAFRVDGRVIAGLSAAKHHLSYLPHSGSVLAGFDQGELEGLEATRGALKFPIDRPPSDALVAKLVAARVAEVHG